jgi:hypothetical protein
MSRLLDPSIDIKEIRSQWRHVRRVKTPVYFILSYILFRDEKKTVIFHEIPDSPYHDYKERDLKKVKMTGSMQRKG